MHHGAPRLAALAFLDCVKVLFQRWQGNSELTCAVPIWFGIALGGAAGALVRYWIAVGVEQRIAATSWSDFPLPTLFVNVAGCFLLGAIISLSQTGSLSPAQRLAVGTGFVGSFTTFSTFIADADALALNGAALRSLLYAAGNLGLGYLAFIAGRMLTLSWNN